MSLQIVVEGDTDFPVARKLAASAGLEVQLEIDCGGKGRLDRNLRGYSDAAKGSPWLVLRDLDDDECAPSLIVRQRLPRARWMCFRIAVRETESWLLADALGIARYLRVDEARVPARPDALADPVAAIVELARGSGDRLIRRGMVPAPGSLVRVGPTYDDQIIDFGTRWWSLERACRRSNSLARARRAIAKLGREWRRAVRGSGPP